VETGEEVASERAVVGVCGAALEDAHRDLVERGESGTREVDHGGS
jgi:hypothetical protein